MLFMNVIFAVVPSIILLRWFRDSDRFPEPWPAIRKVFWRGFLITIPVAFLGIGLSHFKPHDPLYQALFDSFLRAGFLEEASKFYILLAFCTTMNEFNEPMDGFVYGVTASLGFATFENILYVTEGGIGVAITRAVSAVPAHAMFGAVMGYFIARTMIEPEGGNGNYLRAFLIPVILHGMYDFPLMYSSAVSDSEGPIKHAFLMMMIWSASMIAAVMLTLIYLNRLQRLQKRQLTESKIQRRRENRFTN